MSASRVWCAFTSLGLDGLILAIINQTVTIFATYIHLGSEGSLGDFEKIPPHFQMIAIFVSTLISLIIRVPLKKRGQPRKEGFKNQGCKGKL